MPSQIERVLAALNDADVRYLVVGGVAVVLHGYLRTTADLDLVLQLDAPNVARAAQALRTIGLRPKAPVPLEAFTDSDARRRLIDEKGMTVFSLWNPDQPGLEVALFAEEPFDFDAVHRRALRVSLDEIETVVPSLDDLIALKRRAGRPRDLEDIDALEDIRASRRDDGDGSA